MNQCHCPPRLSPLLTVTLPLLTTLLPHRSPSLHPQHFLTPHNAFNQSLALGAGVARDEGGCAILDEEGGTALPPSRSKPATTACLSYRSRSPSSSTCLLHRRGTSAQNRSMVSHLSWNKLQIPSSGCMIWPCLLTPSLALLSSYQVVKAEVLFWPPGFTHCCSPCPECSSPIPI